MKNYFYEEAGIDLVKKYNDEADALVREIENTPTNVTVTGKKYYVAVDGDDSNDGLSPENPWKSIDRVNAHTFEFGDGVFLRRGDSFRITSPLKAKSGMTISAYGEGKKPKLVCSVDASGKDLWEETEYKNIYRYKGVVGGLDTNVGCIVFDNGRAWGVLVSKMVDGTRLDNGPVYNGLEWYKTPYGPFEDYRDLKGNLEFTHDLETETLYLRSDAGNPGEVFESIELMDRGNGINLGKVLGREDHITIDNIEVFGTGSHGIGGSYALDYITIQNCTFKWIGGSVQVKAGDKMFKRDWPVRFGNAVEAYGKSESFTIHHCYATQVYDCCWTAQCQEGVTMNNTHIYKNVAEFANTGPEVWLGDGGRLTNLSIHDNYTRYIGYGWSHQRPCINNCRDKIAGGWIGAGGFFYGAYNTDFYCENNHVKDNIFMFSGSSSNSTAAVWEDKFNFHDNVYIMEDGKRYCYMPLCPVKGDYNEETISQLPAAKIEKNTKFYHMKPGAVGDLYTHYQKLNNLK